MADMAAMSGDNALAFMVSAGLVYEVVAAACSSPQTTELNAGKRSKTLMKWVTIGLVQAGGLVAVAAVLSKRPGPTLLGGGLAMGLMYAQYAHAKSAGLKSSAPGTEAY